MQLVRTLPHLNSRARSDLRDLAIAIAGSVLSFFLASVLMTGWPAGIRPNVDYPYIYAGDGLFQFWLSQRAVEGWIFENARNGFPFGSSFLDFPGSDAGNLLILKILGTISGSNFSGNNLYLLLGFSASFATSFLVLRKIDIRESVACMGALLFAFLPYHFARLLMGHLFYTWYFAIPVYFYAGYRIFNYTKDIAIKRWALLAGVLLILSCFGVYFAFFGVVVIFFCILAGLIRHRSLRGATIGLFLCVSICVGVFANVYPNLRNTQVNGKNPEVAQRSPIESEVYALKLVHLLLPYQQHRIQVFREFTQNYNKIFPLSNTVSAIGIVGLAGLGLLVTTFFASAAGRHVDPRLRILTLLTFMLLSLATVGGLNVLFALLISPMLRGWDRISIFIAFFSLAAACIGVDHLLNRMQAKTATAIGILLCLVTIGILDQTAKPSYNFALSSKARFFLDKKFIAEIENSLPKNSAVYQIPYVAFPEAGNLHLLGGYDLLVGFLHSKSLRWSSGAMQGREADAFYKKLSKKPMSDQIAVAKSMGFSGIYIDGRGYQDNAIAVVAEVSGIVGHPPSLKRDDGTVYFFKFD